MMKSCKANEHSFHFWIIIIMFTEQMCTFYSTLCLKLDVFFYDVFELNTAEHKLIGFMIPHYKADTIW